MNAYLSALLFWFDPKLYPQFAQDWLYIFKHWIKIFKIRSVKLDQKMLYIKQNSWGFQKVFFKFMTNKYYDIQLCTHTLHNTRVKLNFCYLIMRGTIYIRKKAGRKLTMHKSEKLPLMLHIKNLIMFYTVFQSQSKGILFICFIMLLIESNKKSITMSVYIGFMSLNPYSSLCLIIARDLLNFTVTLFYQRWHMKWLLAVVSSWSSIFLSSVLCSILLMRHLLSCVPRIAHVDGPLGKSPTCDAPTYLNKKTCIKFYPKFQTTLKRCK